MYSKSIVVLMLHLFCYTIFAQDEGVDWEELYKQHEHIDSKADTVFESLEFELDSVQVRLNVFKDKLNGKLRFATLEKELTVNYYYFDKTLFLIQVIEEPGNLTGLEELSKKTSFYVKRNDVVTIEQFYTMPSCLGYPEDKSWDEYFGYEPIFSTSYLEEITLKVFKKYIE